MHLSIFLELGFTHPATHALRPGWPPSLPPVVLHRAAGVAPPRPRRDVET